MNPQDRRPNVNAKEFGNAKKGQKKDELRINQQIRAPQIRVIDDEGKMLGVMTVPEALRISSDKGLDLIEIAPTAVPPTCKIMDYGKWKYENKKKQAQARKNQVIVQVKEIQLRPRTDQHDFETKMKHSRRFILDGDKVKVSMRFLGRELAHQEIGMALMYKVIETLKDIATAEANPKMEGKQAFLLLGPDPLKIKDYLKLHPKKSKVEEEKEREEAEMATETDSDSDED